MVSLLVELITLYCFMRDEWFLDLYSHKKLKITYIYIYMTPCHMRWLPPSLLSSLWCVWGLCSKYTLCSMVLSSHTMSLQSSSNCPFFLCFEILHWDVSAWMRLRGSLKVVCCLPTALMAAMPYDATTKAMPLSLLTFAGNELMRKVFPVSPRASKKKS